VPLILPVGVVRGQQLAYSKTAPGNISGYLPITPGPATSSTFPFPSVIYQCLDVNFELSKTFRFRSTAILIEYAKKYRSGIMLFSAINKGLHDILIPPVICSGISFFWYRIISPFFAYNPRLRPKISCQLFQELQYTITYRKTMFKVFSWFHNLSFPQIWKVFDDHEKVFF